MPEPDTDFEFGFKEADWAFFRTIPLKPESRHHLKKVQHQSPQIQNIDDHRSNN